MLNHPVHRFQQRPECLRWAVAPGPSALETFRQRVRGERSPPAAKISNEETEGRWTCETLSCFFWALTALKKDLKDLDISGVGVWELRSSPLARRVASGSWQCGSSRHPHSLRCTMSIRQSNQVIVPNFPVPLPLMVVISRVFFVRIFT